LNMYKLSRYMLYLQSYGLQTTRPVEDIQTQATSDFTIMIHEKYFTTENNEMWVAFTSQ